MTDEALNTAMNEVEESSTGNGFEFELYPYTDRRVRKFGLHRRVFTTRLIQTDGATLSAQTNLPQLIESALQRAVNKQLLDGSEREDDILFINMSSNRLRSAYQSHRFTVGDWRNDTEPARRLLEMLSKILNSNEHFEINDSFHVEITHIKDPLSGSGRKRLKPGERHIDDLLRGKKSVVYINNKDNLCCARALVVAKAKKDGDPRYDTIKRGRGTLQGKMARNLHQEASVPEGPCGLKEIRLFQITLSEYQIVVVSVELGNEIFYKGPNQPEDKQLVLIKYGEHYHTCTSLKGYLGKSYFCFHCEKGFNEDDIRHHRCKRRCYACHQYECSDFKKSTGKASVVCEKCRRSFFGPVCHQNHSLYKSQSGVLADETKRNSVCDTYQRCKDCSKSLRGREILQHKCGFARCPSCSEYLNLDKHKCYLQPVVGKAQTRQSRRLATTAGLATLQSKEKNGENNGEELTPPIFVYYDIEARQDEGKHVANLLCAELEDKEEPFVFEGESCVEAFIDWARSLSTTNDPKITRQVICVAHNFQGYDSYFVLDEFYHQAIRPRQIVNGAKILCMEQGRLKFIDSMAFLPMPLSGLAKAFGLKELKKGFFPHFFNTVDNQTYLGPVPSKDYYDPLGMCPERKKEFEEWHQAHIEEDYKFNFRQELIAYCKSDVRLLKEACIKFQNDFKELAEFNPMENCITIASACNQYYRKMCLQRNTIASEPVRGWHGKSKPHSHAALEWLYWVEHGLRKEELSGRSVTSRLLHAGNLGEHKITVAQKEMYMDGYDEATNTVYEFHGCFYHGCPTCFPNREKRYSKHNDMSMREIYQMTEKRNQSIHEAGYCLKIMWDCEWKRLKRCQSEIKQFIEALQLTSRLEPRDAFYGGRTNAIQLYRKADPREEIRYVDYTSLYPWVNKNSVYPVGHPTIITQPEGIDISNYFGLVKCSIVPPTKLYYPVLPFRYEGKLTFPLCRTCVEEQLSIPLLERSCCCPHDENERSLTGTWCTPELEEAVRQGYVIQKIYEVWNFEKRSTQLFEKYVNTFLKLKQEASNWPSNVGEDPLKRQQYLQNYKEREKVELEEKNIEKNPGKRSLAKLMLNSFWGKFGQGPNKCKVESITAPARLYELLQDDSHDIHSVRVVNDEMIEAVYTFKSECDPVQINTNIFIACFTTCYARLKLYEGIQVLNATQVLYFDTDSIIYAWKEGLPELSLGNYLGEFTNELDDGDYITEFASAGPKNYGFRTQKGKVECKVRGFSLNVRGQEQLNFDILRDNVLAELQQPCTKPRNIPVFNPHKIIRDPKTKAITTQAEIKRYSLVFDKRVVDAETFFSYPYGFQREAEGVE